MKNIIVSCGTGVATSTIVVKKLEEKLSENGIKHKLIQCKAAEVYQYAKTADLIVTTTPVDSVGNVPVIRAMSFLTGIGMDADVEKILHALKT